MIGTLYGLLWALTLLAIVAMAGAIVSYSVGRAVRGVVLE